PATGEPDRRRSARHREDGHRLPCHGPHPEVPVVPSLETVEVPASSEGSLSPSLLVMLYNTLHKVMDRFNGLISLGIGAHATRAGNLDARYVIVTMPTA